MDIEKLKRKQSRLIDMDVYAILLIPPVVGIILILLIVIAVFTWTLVAIMSALIPLTALFFGLCVFRTIVSHKLKKLNQKLLDCANEVDN